MRLAELTPIPITSVLERNWRADIPSWIICTLIALPPVVLNWANPYLYIVPAVLGALITDVVMSRIRHKLRVRDAMTPPAVMPEPPAGNLGERIDFWCELLSDSDARSFVLFSHGTCVILNTPSKDPIADARLTLTQSGHAVPGTPSADMLVFELGESGDFLIGCHDPRILTYVAGAEFRKRHTTTAARTVAAFRGRELRVLDTFSQCVVHCASSTD